MFDFLDWRLTQAEDKLQSMMFLCLHFFGFLLIYGVLGWIWSIDNNFMHHVGKTMLMDMFYSATEGIVKHRRRFHFNEVSV